VTVWNTYRKSHLYILDIVAQISQRLEGLEAATGTGTGTGLGPDLDVKAKAKDIAASLVASVPFLLASNVDEYLRHVNAGASPPQTTNRLVGGLLLIHPLYSVAANPSVPLTTRQYCRRCLDWISEHMGIGQAALLARSLDLDAARGSARPEPDPRLPYQNMSENNSLIWAGMLLQPR
jgi:hypothetical protein